MTPARYFIKTSAGWNEVDNSTYGIAGLEVPSVFQPAGTCHRNYARSHGYREYGLSWVAEVNDKFFNQALTNANPTRPTSEAPPSQDIVALTIAERGKVYGDPYESHRNIGKSWTALLQQHYGITLSHDVSASLVAQLMVVFKMQRSAKIYRDDNYIDAHAYTQFAEEFQKKEQAQ